MALRNILGEDSPELRKICREVKEITPRIQTLLDDMLETMRANKGVGLAAPQVGVLRRIAVLEAGGKIYELINPKIVKSEGTQECEEGCLSVPDTWGIVDRPQRIAVEALDRNGKKKTYTVTGIDVRVFCHEIDHLDGILFIDKMKREIFYDD